MTNLSDFLKVKKVRCINDDYEELTIGRTYELLGVSEVCVKAIGNDGAEHWFLMRTFEPVPNSAENPLQNIKLTPEFEAVEPVLVDISANIQDIGTDILDTNADIKDTPEFGAAEPVTAPRFQAGQKAYCPWLNVGRLVLLESNHTDYLFAETVKGRRYFNNDGTSVDVTSHAQPDLFHATQANYELLCKLMPWVNFEAPPKPLSGSDLARAMLEKGWKYVPCFVSNESDDFAQKMKLTDLIFALDGDRSKEFVGDDVWRYAVPIDPKTGEVLTESILND